jgi:hypothetical protein
MSGFSEFLRTGSRYTESRKPVALLYVPDLKKGRLWITVYAFLPRRAPSVKFQ